MSDQGGRWVGVRRIDGTSRTDWRPDEQPPSPDGSPGSWHVVTEGGEPPRWEWAPLAPAPSPPPGPPQTPFAITPPSDAAPGPAAGRRPRGSGLTSRQLKIGGAVGLGVVVLLAGTLVAGKILGGGGRFVDPNVVIDPASGVALAPGQPLSETLGAVIPAAFGPFQVFTDATGTTRTALEVTFTNNSTQTQHFKATITASAGAGTAPIHEDGTVVTGLPRGQSLTQTVFTRVPAELHGPLAGATFDVSYVSMPPD